MLLLPAIFLLGNVLNLPAQATKKKKTTAEVVFRVNMFCENCKKKIEKNISWEKGVTDLRINLEEKTVKLRYNPQKTTVESLKTAIERLGYTCEPVAPGD